MSKSLSVRFSNGVGYYTTGMMPIPFPEDETVCLFCPCLENDYNLNRARCRRTGEIIPAPEDMRGDSCPIKFKEDA